jgi:putative transposase
MIPNKDSISICKYLPFKGFPVFLSNYPYREWGGKMKHYTQEEIDAFEIVLKTTKKHVMYRKFLVVSLHMKGYTNRQIAEMMSLNKNTVGIYVNTYIALGTDGLIPKKSPGRPRFLTEEQERKLYETIREKTPDDVGFEGRMNWTAKLACNWVLDKFGVQYHINGMLELFHRLKLSYTRPTYTLAKADPELQEQFASEFEEEKKTLER